MGRTQDSGEDDRQVVAVVDGEVLDSTWQQLDLNLVLSALPKAPGAAPRVLTAPASGSVRSFPQVAAELAPLVRREPPKRVPAQVFVSIGAGATAPVPRYRVRNGLAARSANDNHVGSGEKRSMWRDLFFLVVLAATVVGAFWSGRMQGYQKVIVVPGPSSFYSQVT